MRKTTHLQAAVALALITLTACTANIAPTKKGYDAKALAVQEYQMLRQVTCPAPGVKRVFNDQDTLPPIEPFQVFDNFYFVGNHKASSWALTTSDGIILFEAMFHDDVEETVVEGLKKLGFDPADIKYVVIAQGHNDHFGGAHYLQKTYGAHIVMSAIDWKFMKVWPQRGTPAPYPDDDIAITGQDTLTLGDTTVELFITPGHTPGTLSSLIPVKDKGKALTIGYWGGTAMSYRDLDGVKTYLESAKKFRELPADMELSNHARADGLLLKRDALATRLSDDPNPFMTGNQGFKNWMDVLIDCSNIVIEQKKAAQ